MVLAITTILAGIIIGAIMAQRERDSTNILFGLVFGLLTGLGIMIIAVLITTSNIDAYYQYEPETIDLQQFNGNFAAIDGDKIYYAYNNEIVFAPAKYSKIIITEGDPYLIKYNYRGYNDQSSGRLFFTYPTGTDKYEFHIPENSISYQYHYNLE